MNQLLILFFLLFVNMGCADDGASPFPAAYKLGNVVASPIKKAQQTDDEVRQALDKLSSIIKSDAQRQVLLKLLEEQKMQVEKSQDDSPVVTSDFVQHFSNHVQAFIQRFFSAFTEIKGYIKDFKTVEKKVLARFQFICFLLFNLILCLIVERMIRKFIKRRVVIDDQENILPKGVLRWLLGDVIPFIGFVLLFVFLCSFLRAVPYLQDLWFMKVSMRHSIFTSFLSYLLLYRSIILVVRFFSLLAKDIQNRSLDLIQSKPGSMAHNVRYFVYVHSFFMMSSLMVNQSRPRQAWVFLVNFSFACVLAVVLSFSKEKLIRFVDRFLTSYPWSSAGIVGVFLRNLYAVLFFTLVLVFLGWCYPPLNGLASFVEAFYLTVFLFFLMKAGENMSLKYRFFLMRKLNVFVKKPSLKPLVTNRKLADSMRAFIRISRWFAYFVIFSLRYF